MSEGFERQRGNWYYDLEFSFPVTLDHVEQIKGGENILRPIVKCDDKILASRIGYIACYDLKTLELSWTLETPGQSCQNAAYNNELYLSKDEDWLARVDLASGKEVWKVDVHEAIKRVTENVILTSAYEYSPSILHARSKQDGVILWSYKEGWYGYLGGMLCENGMLLVVSESGLHVFIEDTGELLWKYSFQDWQDQYLPDLGQSTGSGPNLLLLADGVFYLGFDQGILAAVDVKTAEPRWFHRVQRPKFLDPASPLVSPRTVIARGQELIFTISQGRRHINYLNIVNVNNGELIYQSDRNITPEGCRGPIVLRRHLVGGSGRYLMVFDIGKKEFVWEYEYPSKLDLFNSIFVPFENGLVVAHNETNSLYWFNNQS